MSFIAARYEDSLFRRASEAQTGMWDGVDHCFADTPWTLDGDATLATPSGWQSVNQLRPGDMILTFDNGFQPLLDVAPLPQRFQAETCPPAFWPRRIPAGTLGLERAVTVMPGQGVMVESDLAEDLCNDPFAVIAASALDGVQGIAPVAPTDDHPHYVLGFAADQLVYVNGGLLLLVKALTRSPLEAATGPVASVYAVQPPTIARQLVADLVAA